VPRYWIVDVREPSAAEWTKPDSGRYLVQRRLRAGDRIALGDPGSPLEGLEIEVADLLGAPPAN